MGYTPPYEITDEIVCLISSVSEKVGSLSDYKGWVNKPHLRRANRIRSVYSSLRIEANPLSLREVSDVINGKTVIGPVKEIMEVKNAYEAYEQMDTVNPYSLEDVKRIHGILTKEIVKESGEFRKGEEGVFRGEQCIFMAPPANLVPSLMEDLFVWMDSVKDTVHPLILAAVFHYEFVFIHPFADGNGRMARLWHTVLLSKWNPLFAYLPLENQIERNQEGYYQAISDCHLAGNSTRFIRYMLEELNLALDEAKKQVRTVNEDISEYEIRLLKVMEEDIPYTANSLLKHLKLKSKDTLHRNYLDPAMAHGFVQMTLPDKPRSKNQRYIKRLME